MITLYSPHFRITLHCSQEKPSSRGQVLTFHTFVVFLSTWPRLDAFVCRQWSVIRKWLIAAVFSGVRFTIPDLFHISCFVCCIFLFDLYVVWGLHVFGGKCGFRSFHERRNNKARVFICNSSPREARNIPLMPTLCHKTR